MTPDAIALPLFSAALNMNSVDAFELFIRLNRIHRMHSYKEIERLAERVCFLPLDERLNELLKEISVATRRKKDGPSVRIKAFAFEKGFPVDLKRRSYKIPVEPNSPGNKNMLR